MSRDRSGYREIYPSILSYSKKEWDQEIKHTTGPEQAARLRDLAEDALRIRNGVTPVKWPDKLFISLLRNYTEHICKTRIARGKNLSRQDVAALERLGMDRKRMFVTIPQIRLAAAKSLKSAFDIIDPQLSHYWDYPITDNVLELMHDFIIYGHGWFGVGEWNMANNRYLNALTWALASNNLPVIEMLVRFAVDTYAAIGDYQSAVNMANDFSCSSFTEIARITEFRNRNDTYESVIIALALNDRWADVQLWLKRIRSELERQPNRNVSEWNPVELLSDVYIYQQNSNALNRLQAVASKIIAAIDSPQQQSGGAKDDLVLEGLGQMTTDDLLKQGISALKTGRMEKARSLLMQVVEQDERNETAWLWLGGTVDTDAERRVCLEKVLAINPSNKAARRGLASLRTREQLTQAKSLDGTTLPDGKKHEHRSKGEKKEQRDTDAITKPPVDGDAPEVEGQVFTSNRLLDVFVRPRSSPLMPLHTRSGDEWHRLGGTPGYVKIPAGVEIGIRPVGLISDDEFAVLAQEIADSGAIQMLDLSNSLLITDAGLAHLEALTQLTSLDLSKCKQITDTGMTHLKPLTRLTSLGLSGCEQITDTGLAHLKALTSLTSLNIPNYYNFTNAGMVHLKALTGLTSLSLGSFSFTEKVDEAGLAHLADLTELINLNFRGWKAVTDAGLAHLRNLTNLTNLNLSECRFTDAGLVHLRNLTGLANLNLSECWEITDAGLVHLKTLPNLVNLNLFCCSQVTDAGLAHLKNLTSLTNLNLSECKQITDAGLAHLRNLTNLTNLNLSECKQITDAGLAHLRNLTSLTNLNLSKCKQITDAGLVHLKDMIGLISLNLLGCEEVTDAGLAHLKTLTSLTNLDLSGCKQVTDAGLAHLKNLTKLTGLNLLACNYITDAGLEHLEGLTEMTSLDLQWCGCITDVGLTHLRNLTSLTNLNLSECNQVADEGLACLGSLTRLTSLDLSGCKQVTNAGMVHLRGLTELTSLNLYRCNHITDTGLAHLKASSRLTSLGLSGCEQITDKGLAHLKAFKDLTSLRLSGCNQITDAGLMHLKDLTRLTILILSECDRITDKGLRYLENLTALTRLYLYDCDRVTDAGKAYLSRPGLLIYQ